MLTQLTALFLDGQRTDPVMTCERCYVERMLRVLSRKHHGWDGAAKGVAQFQEAVRTASGEVCDDQSAAVQLLENLLVDAREFIRLLTVDDDKLVAKLAFYNRLDHAGEVVIDLSEVGVLWVE